MTEPDPTNAPQPEDDGGLRVKVLLAGILVLLVLSVILIGVLVATRERGVNKKAEARTTREMRLAVHRVGQFENNA